MSADGCRAVTNATFATSQSAYADSSPQGEPLGDFEPFKNGIEVARRRSPKSLLQWEKVDRPSLYAKVETDEVPVTQV